MAKRGQGEGTISKRPDGTWWARITVGRDTEGKQKRRAFYGKTRKEVQEKLTAALNEVNNNTYIEPSKMTVEQWLQMWLKTYKKGFVRDSTYDSYRVKMKAVIERIGDIKMKNLQPDMIQNCINDLNTVWSQGTVAAALTILKVAMDQAVDNGIIKTNVAARCKIPRGKVRENRAMTKEEQEMFIEKAKTTRYGDIFLIALATGARIGELIALTWDDVDFAKNLITINKTASQYYDNEQKKQIMSINDTKTRAGNRLIPLLSAAAALLRDIQSRQQELKLKLGIEFEHNLVFCREDGSYITRSTLANIFRNLTKCMGMSEIHIHCLRHTFATRCLEEEVELRVVQELLGHSDIGVTANTYTHVSNSKQQESIKKLESISF